VGPRDSLDGAEILAVAGISPPDRAALGESLYRLCYPDARRGSLLL